MYVSAPESDTFTPQPFHFHCLLILSGQILPYLMFILGLGLYQTVVFLNHSCNPNCIAVFNGSTCDLRSIRNIEPGEELCISYTELMRPQSVRQEVLKKQYYFDCTCSRCLNEIEQGSEMNGSKCANKKCSNAVGFHSG